MMSHNMHHASPGQTEPEPGPTFGGHGQLIVGEGTVYLSHLPMFMFDPKHHPHNFQVILEVTFIKQGSDPQTAYVNDRRKNRHERVYTLAPENFTMTDLVSPDREHPHLRSFKGTIFRGHFERGGVPILEDIGVNVTNVVFFQQFKPDAKPLSHLEYLLFGKGQELFLAHLITKPPDFDQVLSVKVVGHDFTAEDLRQGVQVIFPGRANTISERIVEGDRVVGEVQVAGENGPETLALPVEAGIEFYFEEGELSMPM